MGDPILFLHERPDLHYAAVEYLIFFEQEP
jgi:hypothetical protein